MKDKDAGKQAECEADEMSEESLEEVNGGATDSFMFIPNPPPPPKH